MADVNTVLGGRMEDAEGRVLHPATEAKYVAMADGKSAETKIEELLEKFAGYLSISGGGTVNGPINISGGKIGVNMWAQISAGSDGFVLLANNAYKSQADNKYYYANTHDNIGARGIEFKYGQPGVWWFDTGNVATTAGQEFTPEWRSLTNPDALMISSQDLNNVTRNGTYCGSAMSNAPDGSQDWWWIIVNNLTDNSTNYVSQVAIAVNQGAIYVRNRHAGTWGSWSRLLTTADGIPKQHVSTSAPNNSQGADGDMWDVYV